jgi:adenylate cyclase
MQSGHQSANANSLPSFYADMVGYSRLIGVDDANTLARLKRLRTDLIDPAIAEHRGRIVQTGGDSLLVVFDSIDGAVRCAVKVQQQSSDP